MSVGLRTCLGRSAAAALWLLGAAWTAHGESLGPLNDSDVQLEPVAWTDLDGWTADDHTAAFRTFLISCKPFLARKRVSDTRPIYAALWGVCKRAANASQLGDDKAKARAFFEKYFRPMRIAKLGESTGLLTGYFEPVVDGSRLPNPEFHTPLYRRPRDLVAAGQKPGNPRTRCDGRSPTKGTSSARGVLPGNLKSLNRGVTPGMTTRVVIAAHRGVFNEGGRPPRGAPVL